MIFHVYAIACFVVLSSCSSVETVTTLPDDVKNILQKHNISDLSKLINGTRRIIRGSAAQSNLPYMVYLKLPQNSIRYQQYRRWLCSGVIVHEEYILTSAACIEDAKHFYVVSGTYKHREDFDRFNNNCIKNGAKKAVWKCIPRRKLSDSLTLQNDHGGPMIYGEGVNAIVIGIISACLVKERSNKCYGPFLYTSIYKNRQFISCAIYKDAEPKCRRQFWSGITHEESILSWKGHPDGPAKNELPMQTTSSAATAGAAAAVTVEPAAVTVPPTPAQLAVTEAPAAPVPDRVNANSGFVLRAAKKT